MVYFCDYDYCDVAAGTDICENSDRSYVSGIVRKISHFISEFIYDEQSVSACTDKKLAQITRALAGNLK